MQATYCALIALRIDWLLLVILANYLHVLYVNYSTLVMAPSAYSAATLVVNLLQRLWSGCR